MQVTGLFIIVAIIVIAVFSFGCWLGVRSFETTMSKVVAGILCGLGAVAIAAGIAFGGCLLLLRNANFH